MKQLIEVDVPEGFHISEVVLSGVYLRTEKTAFRRYTPPPSPDGGEQPRAQGVELTEAMIEAGFEAMEKRGFRVGASDIGVDDLAAIFKAMARLAQQPSPSDSAQSLDSLALEYCEEAIEHGPGISTHYVFTLPNLRCLVAKAQPATQILQDVESERLRLMTDAADEYRNAVRKLEFCLSVSNAQIGDEAAFSDLKRARETETNASDRLGRMIKEVRAL